MKNWIGSPKEALQSDFDKLPKKKKEEAFEYLKARGERITIEALAFAHKELSSKGGS